MDYLDISVVLKVVTVVKVVEILLPLIVICKEKGRKYISINRNCFEYFNTDDRTIRIII